MASKRPTDLPNRGKRPNLPTPPKAALAAEKNNTKDSVLRRRGKMTSTPGKARSLSPRSRSVESSPSSGSLATPGSQAPSSSPKSTSASKRRATRDASVASGARVRENSEASEHDERDERIRFLQEQLLEELETRRLVVADRDRLQKQLADMQTMFHSQGHLLKTEFKHHVDEEHEKLHQVQRGLYFRDEEIRELRVQNAELKQRIAGLTRTDEQVSDSHFAQELASLWNSLRNWTATNYRHVRIDWDKLSESQQNLIREVVRSDDFTTKDYDTLCRQNKVSVLMAIINRRLQPVWTSCLGLGVDERVLRDLRALESKIQAPTHDFREWRTQTIQMMRSGSYESYYDAITKIQQDVHDTLGSMTGHDLSDADGDPLRTLRILIDHTADIAMSTDSQRAIFQFHQCQRYSAEWVDEINGDEPTEPDACLPLFPALLKMHADESVTIAKAKVLLLPKPEG